MRVRNLTQLLRKAYKQLTSWHYANKKTVEVPYYAVRVSFSPQQFRFEQGGNAFSAFKLLSTWRQVHENFASIYVHK